MKVFDELKSKLSELELEEEKINELVEFTKKEVPKEFIPKEKYNEKVSELEEVNEKLEETNSKIEELKENSDNLEEYKTKLDKLNEEYNDFKQQADARVANIKKKSILKDKFIENGADPENVDLLMYEVQDKLDDMNLEEDKIIGVDDYIEPIKEKRKNLFIKEKNKTKEPDKNTNKADDDDMVDVKKAMGLL